MLLAIFKEIADDTGVLLYDAVDDNERGAGGPTLPALTLPPGENNRPVYAWDRAVIDIAVATIFNGCRDQGNVLGMDCEWELPFGGSPETPVCTLQLSLPDGRTFLFHLQRGNQRTNSSTFNQALRKLLEDPDITKVRIGLHPLPLAVTWEV